MTKFILASIAMDPSVPANLASSIFVAHVTSVQFVMIRISVPTVKLFRPFVTTVLIL